MVIGQQQKLIQTENLRQIQILEKKITKPVPKDQDGKLVIPVDPEKVKPGDVKVEVEDSKTGNKSDKTIVRVEEREKIVVGVTDLQVGAETLYIKTSVKFASVDIYIGRTKITTIETDSFGAYSYGLTEPIKIGQVVKLVANKEGYNEGKFVERIEN